MKLAFAGKGGVGKTTLAALFARFLADSHRRVIAIDCDPDANLSQALGFGEDIVPVSKMKELIHERMEIKNNDPTYFKLNPKIDDIPEKYLKKDGELYLMAMGGVDVAGTGCICPESRFVKNLLEHMVMRSEDNLIMDMEAGIEHLGRSTAKSVDALVAVVEPSVFSLNTLDKIKKLAPQIGINTLKVIANKIRTQDEERFIMEKVPKDLLLGTILYTPELSKVIGSGYLKSDEMLFRRIEGFIKTFEEELSNGQKK